tara:strand:- start:727 stop:963 length:237 start_codon:yes stop_codon:yes gene_type:complete
MNFKLFDLYRIGNDIGYISFISKAHYITLVVREWEDKETMNGKRQVKILVFPHEYESMEKLNIEEYAEQFPHTFVTQK